MKKEYLAAKIGVTTRTLHKWGEARRKQWQALAADQTATFTVDYFDALNRLTFAVLAFNHARWGKSDISASLTIGWCPSFGIYDTSSAPVSVIDPISLRTTADILNALTQMESIK